MSISPNKGWINKVAEKNNPDINIFSVLTYIMHSMRRVIFPFQSKQSCFWFLFRRAMHDIMTEIPQYEETMAKHTTGFLWAETVQAETLLTRTLIHSDSNIANQMVPSQLPSGCQYNVRLILCKAASKLTLCGQKKKCGELDWVRGASGLTECLWQAR